MTNWLEWTKNAMKISGSFEGRGEDWGNPVRNFDGTYLTCGLLDLSESNQRITRQIKQTSRAKKERCRESQKDFRYSYANNKFYTKTLNKNLWRNL